MSSSLTRRFSLAIQKSIRCGKTRNLPRKSWGLFSTKDTASVNGESFAKITHRLEPCAIASPKRCHFTLHLLPSLARFWTTLSVSCVSKKTQLGATVSPFSSPMTDRISSGTQPFCPSTRAFQTAVWRGLYLVPNRIDLLHIPALHLTPAQLYREISHCSRRRH